MAALADRSPRLYGFFAWTGYFAVVLLPGAWRPVGVAAVAVVTAISQRRRPARPGSAGSIVIYALIIS